MLNKLVNIMNVFGSKMTWFMALAQVHLMLSFKIFVIYKIAQCDALHLINNIYIKILKNIYLSNIIKIYLILILIFLFYLFN